MILEKIQEWSEIKTKLSTKVQYASLKNEIQPEHRILNS